MLEPDLWHTLHMSSPLKKMSNTHEVMCLMAAAGMKPREIAEKLGYAEKSVQTLLASDLFKAQLVELRREMRQSTLGTLLDRIEDEAVPSLEVVLSLRDGNFTDPASGRLQLDAAKFVLGDLHMDRKHPKTTRQETDTAVRITFSAPALRQMLGAVAEDKGEIIELSMLDKAQIEVPKSPKMMLDAPPIEQVVEELEADPEDDGDD